MKAALLTLFFFATTFVGAQNLKFKSDYEGSRSSTLKFETESLEGKFSGNHQTLVLKLKNVSKRKIELNEGSIQLVDITGKRAILCGHDELTLEPGDKITLELSNCNDDSYRGLFQLRREYSSRQLFYDDATFLRNKVFKLVIASEEVKFLTDL